MAPKPRMPKIKITVSIRHLKKQTLEQRLPPVPFYWRPTTRGECVNACRPCPFVGCKYHLFLEVIKSGGISFNVGDDVKNLQRMAQTCALDVAAHGQHSARNVGRLLNLTHQAVSKIEEKALEKVRDFYVKKR